MSTREEDRQKNNCPSRGLGLAAAAIGVGVGAALYYFFSKRPENPDEEGSTSGWSCEQPHAFNLYYDEETDTSMENHNSSTSLDTEGSGSGYTTVSETTTTDTSVHDNVSSTELEWSGTSVESEDSYIDVIPPNDDPDFFNVEDDSDYEQEGNVTRSNSVTDDWDVTDNSLGVPDDMQFREMLSPLRVMLDNFGALFSPRVRRNERTRRRKSEDEQMTLIRAQALSEEEQIKFLNAQKYRERSWSLEECSICFEVMLKDQELTSLPCAHNFHSGCISPWLAEQQTCPNCRKAAE